jgi:hypothetical protein
MQWLQDSKTAMLTDMENSWLPMAISTLAIIWMDGSQEKEPKSTKTAVFIMASGGTTGGMVLGHFCIATTTLRLTAIRASSKAINSTAMGLLPSKMVMSTMAVLLMTKFRVSGWWNMQMAMSVRVIGWTIRRVGLVVALLLTGQHTLDNGWEMWSTGLVFWRMTKENLRWLCGWTVIKLKNFDLI